MRIKFAVGLSILLSSSIYADDLSRVQEYLHNDGIAYCLSHSEIYANEANIARGGYFQLGEHSHEAAKQVQNYIDQALKEALGSYQYSKEKAAYLMRCLEISYSTQYRNYIKTVYALDVIENQNNLNCLSFSAEG